MALLRKYEDDADHGYIVARQEKYIEAYRSGSGEDLDELVHSNSGELRSKKGTCPSVDVCTFVIGGEREGVKRSDVKDELKQTFKNHHDLQIKTRFFHGHKRFTA